MKMLWLFLFHYVSKVLANNMTKASLFLLEMWHKIEDANVYIMVGPKFWSNCSFFICTHCWKLMKFISEESWYLIATISVESDHGWILSEILIRLWLHPLPWHLSKCCHGVFYVVHSLVRSFKIIVFCGVGNLGWRQGMKDAWYIQ